MSSTGFLSDQSPKCHQQALQGCDIGRPGPRTGAAVGAAVRRPVGAPGRIGRVALPLSPGPGTPWRRTTDPAVAGSLRPRPVRPGRQDGRPGAAGQRRGPSARVPQGRAGRLQRRAVAGEPRTPGRDGPVGPVRPVGPASPVGPVGGRAGRSTGRTPVRDVPAAGLRDGPPVEVPPVGIPVEVPAEIHRGTSFLQFSGLSWVWDGRLGGRSARGGPLGSRPEGTDRPQAAATGRRPPRSRGAWRRTRRACSRWHGHDGQREGGGRPGRGRRAAGRRGEGPRGGGRSTGRGWRGPGQEGASPRQGVPGRPELAAGHGEVRRAPAEQDVEEQLGAVRVHRGAEHVQPPLRRDHHVLDRAAVRPLRRPPRQEDENARINGVRRPFAGFRENSCRGTVDNAGVRGSRHVEKSRHHVSETGHRQL